MLQPAAVIFDLFGTLLDVGSLREAAAAYCTDPAAFVSTWREKQIAYAFASTIMRRYEDFDSITERALRFAAAKHGLSQTDRGWETLTDGWQRLAPFADARPALEMVRAATLRCIVLTNATPVTAHAALQSAGLNDAVEATISVHSVAAYKPDARVYAHAAAQLGADASRLLFVSSNGWDATGAGEFGMRVAWCNRAGLPAETFGASPAWTIPNLGELAAILELR